MRFFKVSADKVSGDSFVLAVTKKSTLDRRLKIAWLL